MFFNKTLNDNMENKYDISECFKVVLILFVVCANN